MPEETQTTQSTEHAETASGPAAAFGLNGGLFLAQLVNFAIVLFVLQRWVFKPLIAAMDARRKKVEDGLKDAASAKVKLEEAEQAHASLVRDAHVVARDILEKAKVRADEEYEKRLQKTQQTIESHLKEAELRTVRDADEARQAVMRDAANLVAAAADKVTGKAIDVSAHRALIADAIAELGRQTT